MKLLRTVTFIIIVFVLFPACRSRKPVEEGPFDYQGYPIHPAAIQAVYLAPGQVLDLARFRSPFRYWEWEERPGWYIVDFEQDYATGRVPFFAPAWSS